MDAAVEPFRAAPMVPVQSRMIPMKVLHVSPSYFPAFVYGGPIRSTHQMNLALAAAGVMVRVLTTDSNGRTILPESGKEVAYHERLCAYYAPRSFSPDISIGLLRRLPAAVRATDVVHLTGVYSFTTFPTLLLARIFGRPVFWSPRGALQEWERSPKRGRKAMWDRVCKIVAGRRTTIVAASERELEAARKKFPQCRAVLVENSVEVPQPISRNAPLGPGRVLFLGRIHPIKGIENLLKAVALVIAQGTDIQLTIAGTGEPEYVEGLKRQADELMLRDKARFCGEVEEKNKAALFAESDVLVLPSHSENFGLVVAEALAHLVPVVASQHTPWQGVEKEGCGRWVANDPVSLAQAIVGVLSGDRVAMGKRGRAWMQREFSLSAKAAQLCQYYREARSV
jgi:glycosyltransferase involved in cell wall biosynthesis